MQQRVFTKDWFTYEIPVFSRLLSEFRNKPDLKYLEVGVYEGQSLFWVLENILTHPSSRAIGVDVDVFDNLKENIRISGCREKIEIIKGHSQHALKNLPLNSFDIIYVDGVHAPDDVLADAVLCWQLLKVGGVMIFDDYLWRTARKNCDFGGMYKAPLNLRPQLAIDAFLVSYSDYLEVLEKGYQVGIRKKIDNFAREPWLKVYTSYLGQYTYSWHPKKRLMLTGTRDEVNITASETLLIEELLRSKHFIENIYYVKSGVLGKLKSSGFLKKLKLDIKVRARKGKKNIIEYNIQ